MVKGPDVTKLRERASYIEGAKVSWRVNSEDVINVCRPTILGTGLAVGEKL